MCFGKEAPKTWFFVCLSAYFSVFLYCKKENPYKQTLTNKDNEKRKRQIGQR